VILERLTTPRHILVEKARKKAKIKAKINAKMKARAKLSKKRVIRGNEIGERLEGASFPIRSKGELISELGGKGIMVGVSGGSPMPSEEIADLCFAEKSMFFAAGEVSHAVDVSSWARATVKSLNGVYFPLLGPGEVLRRVGNVTIDGVKIEDLVGRVRYPVKSSAELVDKLVKIRRKYKP
jgi:hypothetical protein